MESRRHEFGRELLKLLKKYTGLALFCAMVGPGG